NPSCRCPCDRTISRTCCPRRGGIPGMAGDALLQGQRARIACIRRSAEARKIVRHRSNFVEVEWFDACGVQLRQRGSPTIHRVVPLAHERTVVLAAETWNAALAVTHAINAVTRLAPASIDGGAERRRFATADSLIAGARLRTHERSNIG